MFRRVFLATAAVVAFAALAAPATYGQGPPPDSAGAAQSCGGFDEPACGGGSGDFDMDGIPDADDPCPGVQPEDGGKRGCPRWDWNGQTNGNLNDVVQGGFVRATSACTPGVCKTTATLSAPKAARHKLGRDRALLAKATKTQKFHGPYLTTSAVFFEFDLPRSVIRKFDSLDQIDLKVKFEVSAPDSPQMRAVDFTEGGIVHFDRRRGSDFRPYPRGQGLYLWRGSHRPADCGTSKCPEWH